MQNDTVVLHNDEILLWGEVYIRGGGVNVQQFRDGVHGEGVCFPLFHCFFKVYVIPKCSF